MNIWYFIKNPKNILLGILYNLGGFIPDKLYLSLIYKIRMGIFPCLKNPSTYQEKMQWLKLHDRKPEYTIMADKYAVKKYVADKIGEKYIIPTLGIWDNANKIEWDALPDKFILKTTHGCGGTDVIIIDKQKEFDKKSITKRLNKSLKKNTYPRLREFPYKNIPRKIIAETYLESSEVYKTAIDDFKLYCFDGEVKFILVVSNRISDTKSLDYFSPDWEHLEICDVGEKNAKVVPEKPENLEEMIRIAELLSKNIRHVRIDLYNLKGKIYFGEFTFYDAGGFARYNPKEWESTLGSFIDITDGI